jgi:LPXTG-motif cell wall-anchored protein
MVRKIVAAGVLVLGLGIGAGTAAAQDSPGPSVSPTTVQVKGSVTLPKTGSDIGVDVIAGLSLTAAGLAFAGTARQRRRRLESANVSTP